MPDYRYSGTPAVVSMSTEQLREITQLVAGIFAPVGIVVSFPRSRSYSRGGMFTVRKVTDRNSRSMHPGFSPAHLLE